VTLRESSEISHYRIVRQLGAGGMGVVYLAEDRRLGRNVALKVLPAEFTRDEGRVRRFEQEARTASALNHPNIITIFDIGDFEDTRYIVTEWIDGETLRQQMGHSPMPISEVLRITIQVAEALAAAHAAGVVHRDIKPENIMLRRDGWVKVLDFGLAKLVERPSSPIDEDAPTKLFLDTTPGMVMGTVRYMSPEQARGTNVDARTDVFSLGVVMYEMIARRPPFQGPTATDVIASILQSEPPRLTDAPPELERVVMKALAKNPAERYQNAGELADELRQLTSSPEVTVRRTAPRKTKWGIAAAIAILVVIVAGVFFNRVHTTRGPINTLAVLPFANSTGDANDEYLSDGLTEALINDLSRLPNLKVMSRNAVWKYKQKTQQTDLRAIADDLNVRAVLVGGVARRGRQIAINAELVDARDNTQIWGKRFERDPSEVMAVQEEIAGDIAEGLRVRLSGEDKKALAKRHTESGEAYELYLKGRYYVAKRSEDAILKGRDFYRQAIDKDPAYALAYAGLSDTYTLLQAQAAISPNDAYPAALATARKALDLDPDLAEAHAAFAHASLHVGDYATAEREYARALALKPNSAAIYHGQAEYASVLGRHDEALSLIRKALALDPLDLAANAQFAWFLTGVGKDDEAIVQARKTLEIDPNYFVAHSILGTVYVRKKRFSDAIAEFKEVSRLTNGNRGPGGLGAVYAMAGNTAEARRVAAEMEARSRRHYTDPLEIALIYALLHDRENTIRCLTAAHETGQTLRGVEKNPDFAFVRNDPRVLALMAQN
jgi:serine/threonine-protein kinase